MKNVIESLIEEIETKKEVLGNSLNELGNEDEIIVVQNKIDALDKSLDELNYDLEMIEDIERNSDLINSDYSIAVEDWALYNEGWLACKWWDKDSNIDDIENFYKLARKYILRENFDEVELFIADSDTPMNSEFTENTCISDALEKLNRLYDLDNRDIKKVEFLISENFADDLEDAISKIDDVCIYENMDMEDIARDYIDSCYTLDDFVLRYFDFKSFGDDLESDGNYFTVGSDIFEYRN